MSNALHVKNNLKTVSLRKNDIKTLSEHHVPTEKPDDKTKNTRDICIKPLEKMQPKPSTHSKNCSSLYLG